MESTALWASMLLGFLLGIGSAALYVTVKVKQPDVSKVNRFTPALAAAMVLVLMAANAGRTLAQTAVPLNIPTDVIFTETNTWIETFAPIAAIGIGITVALAVLGYLGKMIAGAFKG